jgi:hypothetical protein
MDVIEVGNRNCVATECGHCFHTNCLMQSVAHNGFGCPYCRTVMAEVPDEEDSDDEEEDEENYLEDDTLRGYRFFWNNADGVSHDSEDEIDENEMEEDINGDEDEDESNAEPDAAYVAQKLVERGITFEDLVKTILIGDHSIFGTIYRDYERRSSEVHGQFRAVISRYEPLEPQIVEPTPAPQIVEPTPAPEEPIAKRHVEVDFEAQTKITKVRLIREVSSC